MNRRIILSVGGGTAGLMASAFLPVAVAFADTAGDGGSAGLGSLLSGSTPLGATSALAPVATTPTAAPLGSTGGVTPSASTPSASPLGDTGSTAPVGNVGGLTPTATTPTGSTPDATTPSATTPDATTGATPPAGSDAFTIGHDTFNPVQADGSEGFSPVSPLFSAPPFFQVGSGDQSFDVTSGTGSGATDLGNVTTSEDVSNLFGGIHNTEFTITGVNPASGGSAADLPAVGSVYDVANFGHGYENIYSDIPGATGSANTITDTLVTPYGDFNIPTDFNAAGQLDPGDAFSGVSSLGAGAAGGAADAAAGGAADAATGAAGGAADAAGGAADAAGGAADAAHGIGDAMSGFDPFGFLGL